MNYGAVCTGPRKVGGAILRNSSFTSLWPLLIICFSSLSLSNSFPSLGTWLGTDARESRVHSLKGPAGGALNKAKCLVYWQWHPIQRDVLQTSLRGNKGLWRLAIVVGIFPLPRWSLKLLKLFMKLLYQRHCWTVLEEEEDGGLSVGLLKDAIFCIWLEHQAKAPSRVLCSR